MKTEFICPVTKHEKQLKSWCLLVTPSDDHFVFRSSFQVKVEIL